MEQKRLKTARDLADIMGVDLKAVYRYTRRGEFDSFLVKIGAKPQYRYRTEGLEEYLQNGGTNEKAVESK